MKITSSHLDFQSQYHRTETKSYAKQTAITGSVNNNSTSGLTSATGTRVSLNSSQSLNTYSTSSVQSQSKELVQHQQQKTLQSMLSKFYQGTIRVSKVTPFNDSGRSRMSLAPNAQEGVQTVSVSEHYHYRHQRQQNFVATGSLETEAGETIKFQFYASAQQHFEYEAGSGLFAEQINRRTDPLVIHLEGGFDHLSDAAFEFDIDGDGDTETLSFAGAGSGFLVLDKNRDGLINDGTEMFGTRTGNGFNELAEFDDDGNGFIDEGDAIYKQLKVYSRDSQGQDTLRSLEQVGVAAIGLSNGESPFVITDDYNNELGVSRRSGIFVSTTGHVGAIQQIDLTQRNIEQEKALKAALNQAEGSPEQNSDALMTEGEAFQAIENAMAQLDAATDNLLNRQDELAQLQDEDEPKSLLQQLVDTLEDYTTQQQDTSSRNGDEEKPGDP